MNTIVETRWIVAAGFEPTKGHRVPEETEDWQLHMAAGWQPAGPSLQLPIPTGFFVFAMVMRERPTLVLPKEES